MEGADNNSNRPQIPSRRNFLKWVGLGLATLAIPGRPQPTAVPEDISNELINSKTFKEKVTAFT